MFQIEQKQAFKIECREQLAVSFLPSKAKTQRQGWFLDEETICLQVQPRDKNDTLLGPGWADRVGFLVPGTPKPWPAVNHGDSIYSANIHFQAIGPRFDKTRRALVADELSLKHPVFGEVGLGSSVLPLLSGFAVNVLGVVIPVEVRALVGSKRTKEVHLATCGFAAKIKLKQRVFIRDLDEAKKYGFDACRHCLPEHHKR